MLVSSPHPPLPRMCLYYACVCIYMCVYIHTVYVYIYICSMCNLWWKSPESSYVFALLYSLIFRADKAIFPPNQSLVCQLAKDTEPNLFVLTEQRKYFNKAATLFFFSPPPSLSFIFSLFPVSADVKSEVTSSGSFKFLENVSLSLVLHKSSGSNILVKQIHKDCAVWKSLDPKRTGQNLPSPCGVTRMNMKKKMNKKLNGLQLL